MPLHSAYFSKNKLAVVKHHLLNNPVYEGVKYLMVNDSLSPLQKRNMTRYFNEPSEAVEMMDNYSEDPKNDHTTDNSEEID